MRDRYSQAPETGSDGVRRTLGNILVGLFLVGGLFFGYLFYVNVRDIVAYAGLSGPGIPAPRPVDKPVKNWQLTRQVNILLLGIDRRENEEGPWRTDTMILVSVDPISKTASMLSIPRDLWVPLPVLNFEDRINTAHSHGDSEKYKDLVGGGPALAMKTVEYNLGVPVDYYARIDFPGFEKLIDAIGGVDIDVLEDIYDAEYPTPDGGTIELFFKKGPQHMNGDLALKYARTRHQSNDIDRAGRQQQVIMAARDKVLSLKFPVTRIPEQIQLLGDSVESSMNLDEIIAVARVLQQVDRQNIKSGIIDGTMVFDWTRPDGQMVLVPQWEPIRQLVNELFPPIKPVVVNNSEPPGDQDKLAQEAARIEVQNGTETAGLASKMATELKTKDYNIVSFGNADRFDYQQTVIICYADKEYTLSSLKAYLGVDDARIEQKSLPGNDIDIRIILGKDAVTP